MNGGEQENLFVKSSYVVSQPPDSSLELRNLDDILEIIWELQDISGIIIYFLPISFFIKWYLCTVLGFSQ